MTKGEWISITSAEEQIWSSRLGGLGHGIAVWQAVWQEISERLIGGTLVARPRETCEYSCIFRGQSERQISLIGDGLIPPEFWVHYRDAEWASGKDPLVSDNASRAERRGNDFHFHLAAGLIENGSMEGLARGVTVERVGLADLLPGLAGRRLGSQQYDDAGAVAEGLAWMQATGKGPYAAARHFVDRMEGASSEAKFRRLAQKLRAANGRLHGE